MTHRLRHTPAIYPWLPCNKLNKKQGKDQKVEWKKEIGIRKETMLQSTPD